MITSNWNLHTSMRPQRLVVIIHFCSFSICSFIFSRSIWFSIVCFEITSCNSILMEFKISFKFEPFSSEAIFISLCSFYKDKNHCWTYNALQDMSIKKETIFHNPIYLPCQRIFEDCHSSKLEQPMWSLNLNNFCCPHLIRQRFFSMNKLFLLS